ncbi:hypothetical protein D3C87_1199230 [compost metagenome]
MALRSFALLFSLLTSSLRGAFRDEATLSWVIICFMGIHLLAEDSFVLALALYQPCPLYMIVAQSQCLTSRILFAPMSKQYK